MKAVRFLFLLPLGLILLQTSCCRNSNEVWDDTCTAGRYWGKGFCALGGKQGDSRQVCSRSDFDCDPDCYDDSCYQAYGFIPMQDESGGEMIAMTAIEQPRFSPGERGSQVPGIEQFKDPKHDPHLATLFENINFPYNSDQIRGDKNLRNVARIADYLKDNPQAYVFVEGHCDERGAEAYNLALGSRRANSVRNLLVQEGVPAEQVYTISYGKEKPIAFGHDEAAWTINRRAQFKLWSRR